MQENIPGSPVSTEIAVFAKLLVEEGSRRRIREDNSLDESSVKLLYRDLQQLFSIMQWQHSPIRISSKINLPTIQTPSPLKSNSHQKTAEREEQIARARDQVLSLKNRGDLEAALGRINQLINIYPSDIRSYQIKGELVFGLKMYQDALETYDQLLAITSIMQSVELTNSPVKLNADHTLIQLKRMRALYYFNKGLCLQKLNRHKEAIETLKKSKQLNKNRTQTYVYLAESYRVLKMNDKLYKIYTQLIDQNPSKSQFLLKAIKICNNIQDYQPMLHFIDKGLRLWDCNQIRQTQEQAVLIQLINLKGDAFKNMERYDQAIHSYQLLLSYSLPNQKLVKLFKKIALCYDFLGNLSKASDYYVKLLQVDPSQIQTLNNLGNIYLRQGKYEEAANILKKQCEVGNANEFSCILLRCHRVIALSKLSRTQEASKELSEIMAIMCEQKLVQMQSSKEWENYKFVRYIIDKYKHSFAQLSLINKQRNNQSAPAQQLQAIEKELICSISQQLSKEPVKQEGKAVDLEKLEQRIDRLYNEIVAFKKKTLQQHEQNSHKVHNKIVEIQQLLVKREEDNQRLEKELDTMKLQHYQIYNLIQTFRKNHGQQLTSLIQVMKKEKRNHQVMYMQQMYWLFNAYLIAIRLIANQLVTPASQHPHLNKVSSFFSKFKQVFQTLSHIPHIGTLCEVITATISLYLSLESTAIYRTLHSIISNNYYIEQDLHSALQEALVTLMDSSYVKQALRELKSNYIPRQKTAFTRAYAWFKQKKNKLVQKMFSLETNLSMEEKAIQQLVVEDISAIFVYLVKNRQKYLVVTESKPQTIKEALQKTLILGFKQKEINLLYSQSTCQEAEANRRGQSCSQCQVYNMLLPPEPRMDKMENNQLMDQLIADAIRQNNTELFSYAVSRLTFNWF